MLTAAITAATVWILSLFGIKPGPSVILGVAVVVKILIVLAGVLLGAKVVRKRVQAKESAGEKPADPGTPRSAGGDPPSPPVA